jgi:hypothetical protein
LILPLEFAGHIHAGNALLSTPLGGATFTGSKSFGPMFAGLGLLISLVLTASFLICSTADTSALQQAVHGEQQQLLCCSAVPLVLLASAA